MDYYHFGLRGKDVYLSYDYLISKGIPDGAISELFESQQWIKYKDLPGTWVQKYDLPKNKDEAIVQYELQKGEKEAKSLNHISLILDNAWSEPLRWKRFVPEYRKYCLDYDILVRFSKTHSLFFEILELKKTHSLRLILTVYQSFVNSAFRTRNYNSFSAKVRQAEKDGILLALIHAFKFNGRPPVKVDGFLRTRVKYFYSLPKKYTYNNILDKVNQERLERGLSTVSLSTVKRILADRELRNECDPIRFGQKYAETYLYPYFSRKEPSFCQVLQIDSSRFNIPYWNSVSKKVSFLVLCVLLEVKTRCILAATLDYTENTNMILETLKKGLRCLGYVPKQIVVDNHASYHSKVFKKFSNNVFELGTDIRYARQGNAKDKAHIERWFGTFQTRFTNHIFGSMGEGVKSSRRGGRVAQEWEKIFLQKKHLRDENTLRNLVMDLIEVYNSDTRSGISPHQLMVQENKKGLAKLSFLDLAYLFYKKKVKMVSNNQVQFRVRDRNYEFKVDTNLYSVKNGQLVTVMYDKENLTSIQVYDETGKHFLCESIQKYQINLIATKKDLNHIKTENSKLKKRIHKTNSQLMTEFEESKKTLKSIPVISLDRKESTKVMQEDEKQDEWMLRKAMKLPKDDIAKNKISKIGVPPKSNRRKGSLKKIQ